VLLAVAIARASASRIIAPLIVLAEAVQQGDAAVQPHLLIAADEVGFLARAFQARTSQLWRSGGLTGNDPHFVQRLSPVRTTGFSYRTVSCVDANGSTPYNERELPLARKPLEHEIPVVPLSAWHAARLTFAYKFRCLQVATY
jgi:HAMP domain-containing protein